MVTEETIDIPRHKLFIAAVISAKMLTIDGNNSTLI